MRIQFQELFVTDTDLGRLLELVGKARPDVEIHSGIFESEGLLVKGAAQTPLGKLAFEKRWKAKIAAPGVVMTLAHLKVGQSFPIPFLKSMVLEQVRDLLKPWPGISVVGDEILIDYKAGMKAQGIEIDGALASLELEKGGCRLGFTHP